MMNEKNKQNKQSNLPIDSKQNIPVKQKGPIKSEQNLDWKEQLMGKFNQNISMAKNKYEQHRQKRQDKLYNFPQAKTYPTKPHSMQIQQLRKFNFAELSPQQLKMLQDLSTFTPHRQFIKMLTNRYSDVKKKEYFIKEHSSVLSSDQFGQFNRAKFQYQKNSRTFAAFCTGSLSLAGFMIGLWVLPARKSPWKYSFIGLGVGLGLSYGFWRMQILRYHKNMNQQFKVIIKDKYENEKKSQKAKQKVA